MSHTLGFAVIVERLELCCVCPECKSSSVHDLYFDDHVAANAYYLKDMVQDPTQRPASMWYLGCYQISNHYVTIRMTMRHCPLIATICHLELPCGPEDVDFRADLNLSCLRVSRLRAFAGALVLMRHLC